MTSAVLTVGLNPEIHVGPLTLAWHGLTIAIGILAGGMLATRLARRRGMDVEPLYTIGLLLTVSALVGSRVYFLIEHGKLDTPSEWVGTTGFTFNGGLIAAAASIAVYLRRQRLAASYLDLVALALPLGVAIGRIGDVINGEHYGPATTFFLGIRNSHPDALTPRSDLAYHNGGFYEVLLGTAIFLVVWPMRDRLMARATAAAWLVLALFGIGRFVVFFARSDSEDVALGLNAAQWTSVALVVTAVVGACYTLGRARCAPRRGEPSATPAAQP